MHRKSNFAGEPLAGSRQDFPTDETDNFVVARFIEPFCNLQIYAQHLDGRLKDAP